MCPDFGGQAYLSCSHWRISFEKLDLSELAARPIAQSPGWKYCQPMVAVCIRLSKALRLPASCMMRSPVSLSVLWLPKYELHPRTMSRQVTPKRPTCQPALPAPWSATALATSQALNMGKLCIVHGVGANSLLSHAQLHCNR